MATLTVNASMFHPIDVYYTFIEDWNLENVQNSLLEEELNLMKSIVHLPTLKQKMINRALLKYALFDRNKIQDNLVMLEYNERGKPLLKNYPNIHFNSSHSCNLVLIALTENYPLGVDVEFIHKSFDEDNIVKNFFSHAEYSSYKNLYLKSSNPFFQFWTAKEAVIKALGKGLWEGNKVPEVIWKEECFSLKSESNILLDWSLVFLELHEEYSICLAINKQNVRIRTRYVPYEQWSAFQGR